MAAAQQSQLSVARTSGRKTGKDTSGQGSAATGPEEGATASPPGSAGPRFAGTWPLPAWQSTMLWTGSRLAVARHCAVAWGLSLT